MLVLHDCTQMALALLVRQIRGFPRQISRTPFVYRAGQGLLGPAFE